MKNDGKCPSCGDPVPELVVLLEKVARLEAHARGATVVARMPLGGMTVMGTPGGSKAAQTIRGIEELVMVIDAHGLIRYCNSAMARFLMLDDDARKSAIPLAERDATPLGDGALTELWRTARDTGRTAVHEVSCPGLNVALLPPAKEARPHVPPILRLTAVPESTGVSIVLQDVTRVRWLEQTFARYLSPRVIEQMEQMQAEDFFKMRATEISVLFADLRGFTAMSQHLPPEEVGRTINEFLSRMVEPIEQWRGMVDKYVGDEIMALFGAPLWTPSHAANALACAATMQDRHESWRAERTVRELPAPQLGIGIATGKVIVGNIGTESRSDYTALGHTVNLAARLCGHAAGGEILTVDATYEKASSYLEQNRDAEAAMPFIRFAEHGDISFKNIDRPVPVLKVIWDETGEEPSHE